MSGLGFPSALSENVIVLPQTNQLKGLFTIIRDCTKPRSEFIFYANRIIRLIVEEGLNYLPVSPKTVTTAQNASFDGVEFDGRICGVSIMRAGESMEQGLRECCRSVRIGKILIQRNEETQQPVLFYKKLPKDVATRYVLLLDPMLATGGSAIKAIEVLLDNGCKQEQIIFLNVIASPAGIKNITAKFPKLRIVTAAIDDSLDERGYIIPGLGDFGDIYFGTEEK
ncbi:uracil phosphoribosyltransferase [Schizosaccharomyces japonicus yFS275]|uniref:uracil phosphoribosyltransferase n=1 Tax=Schizosaccharomyces japonicus (strain yFS275 / FY16936) TaxID=402676 RepID=B6K6L9_SCHJY|nr:uracil phosphoribosyltransferase [Schizosaccharomyces japonicus yFS275]EEB09173.2 uracil phosphoribosyltransferase [Schizosaccharomyces japonicus yFS275]